ncbi:hypothetical protein AMTRI_Chr08g204650 [Amborella trichopoda]
MTRGRGRKSSYLHQLFEKGKKSRCIFVLCSICNIFIFRTNSIPDPSSFSSSSYLSKTGGLFQLTCLIIEEKSKRIGLKPVYTNYPVQLLLYTTILFLHQKIFVPN